MFDLGSTYPAALDVFNAAGVPADPATATLTITLPDGTTASPAVPLPSAVPGQLRTTYLTTMPGRHLVRWVLTGPNIGFTDAFDVAEAAPPIILSLADAKQTLQIDAGNTDDDNELRAKLIAITAAIEDYKHEAIARRVITNEEHVFDQWTWSWQTPRLRLNFTPVISLTSLVSFDHVVTWNIGDLDVDLQTGIVNVVRGTPITGQVLASYVAGYQVIPYNYLEGAKVFLQHVWESRRGPGGVGGVVGPEELHTVQGNFYAIPRKAMEWFGARYPVVL